MAAPGGTDDAGGGDRAARILARLAHRFADREAILWRGGLDEGRWTALEQELLADLDGAPPAKLAAFARAFVAARLELTQGGASAAPSPEEHGKERGSVTPPSTDEAAPTLPKGAASLAARFGSTAPLGTPRHASLEAPLGATPSDEAKPPSSSEPEAVSATLHAGSRRSRSAPPKK